MMSIDPGNIKFRETLVLRLVLPLLVLAALLFAALSLVAWYTYVNEQKTADLVPVKTANVIQEKIASFLGIQEVNLTRAADSLAAASQLDDREKAFLTQIVQDDPAIPEVVVFDLSHTVVYRAIRSNSVATLDVKNQLVEKSLRKVSETRHSDITDTYETKDKTAYVIWTFPVIDTNGNVTALLSATIDVSTFWQYLADATPSSFDATILIVNSEGNLFVSNKTLPQKNIAQKIRDVLFTTNTHDSVIRYYGIEGEKVAGYSQILTPTSWTVLVEVPLSKLLYATYRNLVILACILILILLQSIYTFYAFQHNLSLPLAAFRKGVIELSQGNYRTRIVITVHNELATLANVINTMAQNIETQTSEIVTRLKSTIADLDRSAKTLIKRDEELSRANDRLERLDHAKSEFVSIAAHQLRTPLSALKWAQQMLLDGDAGQITENQKTLLMQSQDSVYRMVHLVNDLLSADHLEYGKVTYNFALIGAESVIASIVAELRPMATERKITLTYQENKNAPQINADPERLKEAFLNLLNNAIKYTGDGGAVNIQSIYGVGEVCFTITDSGIGIPKQDSDRLFEKFVRMDNAKKVDANGSGLGLFIVKKIIDAHNGTIWFNSTEGKGTTFFVKLPTVTHNQSTT